MTDRTNTTGVELRDSFSVTSRPTLAIDIERYQAYLDGSNMTEAQKSEFLQALWSIVVNFVELGFDVHPLQEVCGQDAESHGKSAKRAFDQV